MKRPQIRKFLNLSIQQKISRDSAIFFKMQMFFGSNMLLLNVYSAIVIRAQARKFSRNKYNLYPKQSFSNSVQFYKCCENYIGYLANILYISVKREPSNAVKRQKIDIRMTLSLSMDGLLSIFSRASAKILSFELIISINLL